jgi:excisionase family DNA binding protein
MTAMGTDAISTSSAPGDHTTQSPWLTVEEAGERARCGVKTIYREVRAGRLKAARVGGRRELRLLSAWVDEWLLKSAASDLVSHVDRTCVT